VAAALRRAAPALVVLAGISAVALLWIWGSDAYLHLRAAAGLKPYSPFLDLHAVMSAIECWHRGVDVYAQNPCDVFGRLHIYSPLWLRLPPVFGDPALLRPLGLLLAVAFAASLLWLPAPPRGRAELAVLLATASPVVAFALERANADLLIFLLVVAGALLAARGQAARIGGYALFLLGALLKFYPLVLLAVVLRERPRVVFALVLVAAAIVQTSLGAFGDETRRAIGNIHIQALFWGSFAAHNLPRGLLLATGSMVAAALALAAGMGVAALAIRRVAGVQGLATMDPVTRSLLLVCGTLVVGCFLAGENIEYRAIFLLPTLPALLALPATRHAGWLAAALMWEPLARRIAAHLSPASGDVPSGAGMLLWAVHNLAWWWMAGVLLALVLTLLRNAPGLALLRPWATGRPGRR
jgi:hypothetical protein